jgi:hypothetical protein
MTNRLDSVGREMRDLLQADRPPRYTVGRPREAAEREAGARRATAIVVAHGMGQQIPFQTLDAIAEGLRRHDARIRRVSVDDLPKPNAVTIAIGDARMQRLELTLGAAAPDGREVHVYEAYWAPLTEGKVALLDVVSFLVTGGVSGVRHGLKPLRRWMFDGYRAFRAPVRTVMYLIVALAVIASLAMLDAIVLGVVAARAPLANPPRWLTRPLFDDLTILLNVFVLISLVFAVSLLLAKAAQKFAPRASLVAGPLSIALFIAAIAMTIACGIAAPAVVTFHVMQSKDSTSTLLGLLLPQIVTASVNAVIETWLTWALVIAVAVALAAWVVRFVLQVAGEFASKHALRAFSAFVVTVFALMALGVALEIKVLLKALGWTTPSAIPTGPWQHALAWGFLFVISFVVRNFLLEYAGDVAAYVQPQRLDRFFQIRNSIRDTVWQATAAVYAAPERYERILLVGHSLGSVVIYDVLNRLLLEDRLARSSLRDAAQRTKLLLTFGSPLDKTAFIFSVQGSGSEAREALASSLQPLLTDESVRPPWTNIYSKWDFISGKLDYYDLADKTNRNAVHNVADPQATTLLAAHTEYWTNDLLFRILYDAA